MATSSRSFSWTSTGRRRRATWLCDLSNVSAPYLIDGHQIVIGASVGVTIAPTDGVDADHLLKNADMALYRAKSQGGVRFASSNGRWTTACRPAACSKRNCARRSAGEFEVYYQPLFNIAATDLRLRSTSALASSDARHGPSGRVHSSGRGNRPHRRDRRLGVAPGLLRRFEVASPSRWRSTSLRYNSRAGSCHRVGALAASGLAARAAGAGDNRNCASSGERDDAGYAAQASRPRRPDRDGRFRHRLFQPQLSPQLSLRQDQDRSILH